MSGVGYFGLGLSLLLAFALSSFTETDRKERRNGYPAWLFTLPVSSGVLAGAPMAFGASVVALLYIAWSLIAFPFGTLPLTWPIPYVCAAMACYQATLWALAQRRVIRLIALGYGGSVFAMAWMAFRRGTEVAPELRFELSDATREGLTWGLFGTAVIAFVVAWIVIETQRSGGMPRMRPGRQGEFPFGTSTEARPARPHDGRRKAFATPAAAQFWLEWRRHGMLLPLATAGILLLIVAPAPFFSPISSGMAVLGAFWMCATPLLIGFVLGKGLGKADLWSSDPSTPLFMATKPISADERISAKLRMAGAASVAAWALIGTLLPLWLWLWCDYGVITGAWDSLRRTNSLRELLGVCSASAIAAILLTFRFLAGSIYIGLSGRRWAVNLSACAVFLALFGALAVILALSQRSSLEFIRPAPWMPWILIGLFALKLCASCAVTIRAIRAGCLNRESAKRYGWFWLITTGLLLAPLCLFAPTNDDWKWLLTSLALFVVPFFRTALAPLAITYSARA